MNINVGREKVGVAGGRCVGNALTSSFVNKSGKNANAEQKKIILNRFINDAAKKKLINYQCQLTEENQQLNNTFSNTIMEPKFQIIDGSVQDPQEEEEEEDMVILVQGNVDTEQILNDNIFDENIVLEMT